MTKKDIIKQAIERFPELPTRAIARYILYNYGDLFDGSLEKVRNQLRYYLGAYGNKARNQSGVKKRTKPVVMPQTWRTVRTDYNLKAGLWLILSDIHVPFHEPKPLEAAIKYGQKEKVNGILLNGDAQDCASVSYWPSARKRNFDREVEIFIDIMDLLKQELPGAEIVYKPGNHEYRLPRLFQAKVPELIGLPLAAVESALGLEQRGIEYLDYYQIVRAGKLPIIHGHEIPRISLAVNPARGLFLKAKTWAMCGHCHTSSSHTAKNLNGKLLTTWSTGCLCDLTPDYNPYGNDWNWGFALVNVEKNGDFTVFNKRVLPNGNIA